MKKTGKSYKPNGKSEERKDQKSGTGMNGSLKKRGHEGKFTWVGDGYGKSEERKDQKSGIGMNGSLKKRGHEGKFTWVGDGYSQPEIGFESGGVFDVKDPNFEDPDETFTV